MIKVKAFRTHHTTKVKTEVEIEVSFNMYPDETYTNLKGVWCEISEGGVTGYEGCEVAKLDVDSGRQWYACMGTEGKWDELLVPTESVDKIVERAAIEFPCN
jgi:hypothetical protein